MTDISEESGGGGTRRDSRPGLSRTQILLSIAFLAVFSLLLYTRSCTNEFVWDSGTVFRDDPSIRHFRSLPDYFREEFLHTLPMEGTRARNIPYYRPLLKTFHLFEYQLFGTNPVGYNVVSIVVNAAVVVFAFLMVLDTTGSAHVALLAGLLYAANPARVEAVSWAYSDSYLLSSLFVLAALLLYRRRTPAAPPALFAGALLIQESAVLLPAVLVLHDLLVEREGWRRTALRVLPYAAIAAAYLAVRRLVVGSLAVTSLPPVGIANTIAVIIKRYAKIFFIPDGPVTVYRNEVFPGMSSEVAVAYGAIFVLAVVAAVLWRRDRLSLFWYAWFFVWISVTFNVGTIGEYLMADKVLYLASLGFCVVLVRSAERFRPAPSAALLVVVVLIVLHGAVTFDRTRFWRSEASYFEEAVEFDPGFYPATYMLGNIYAARQQYGRAIALYEQTVSRNSRHTQAYTNLGNVRYLLGERARAAEAWERARAADPANPMPYYNLGMLREQEGDLRGALRLYRQYLALEPAASPAVRIRIEQLAGTGGLRTKANR